MLLTWLSLLATLLCGFVSTSCQPGKSSTNQNLATPPEAAKETSDQAADPRSQAEYEAWYNSPPAPWQEDPKLGSSNQAPLAEGEMVVTAITSNLGDYESIKTVVSVSSYGVQIYASANVPHQPSTLYKDDPPFRRVHAVVAVKAEALQHATAYGKDFTPGEDSEYPAATAISFSSDLLANLKSGKEALATWPCGETEVQCAHGPLKRIEPHPVPFPVLLRGQRVNLPAVHARCKMHWSDTMGGETKDEHGQYVIKKVPPYTPCDFWILDNPDNPLVLAWEMRTDELTEAWLVSRGAQPAPPEHLHLIEIDYLPKGFLTGPQGTVGPPLGSLQGLISGPINIECARKAATAPEYVQRCMERGASSDSAGNGQQGTPGDQQANQIEQQLARKEPVQIYGVYFDFARANIRPESDQVLSEIAGILNKNPDWTLSVDGHTDNIGGAAFNQQLSEQRAAAVKGALVTRYHITPSRLVTRGYGLTRPVETNDTPEGRARNRRVELMRQ